MTEEAQLSAEALERIWRTQFEVAARLLPVFVAQGLEDEGALERALTLGQRLAQRQLEAFSKIEKVRQQERPQEDAELDEDVPF